MTLPYPEKDVALLPTRDEPYNPSDWGPSGPPQEVDPDIDWQEVDISLLPGVPGQRGPVGPQGPPGVDGETQTIAYTHIQNEVSSTWSIIHNLGFYPNVSTTDVTGFGIEGTVNYVDTNSLIVTFGIATTGNAYLS